MLVREVPGHPHGMTFGNIKFHLPIGLPLGNAVQVILQNLAINGGFYIPIKHTIIIKEAKGRQNGYIWSTFVVPRLLYGLEALLLSKKDIECLDRFRGSA